MEEIPELLTCLKREGRIDGAELADIAILLFDIAHMSGVDLEAAIFEKLEINRKRKWKVNNGILSHIDGE
jgi:NTP pyrophosphatase (non-canonical NTP hydrolase)